MDDLGFLIGTEVVKISVERDYEYEEEGAEKNIFPDSETKHDVVWEDGQNDYKRVENFFGNSNAVKS